MKIIARKCLNPTTMKWYGDMTSLGKKSYVVRKEPHRTLLHEIYIDCGKCEFCRKKKQAAVTQNLMIEWEYGTWNRVELVTLTFDKKVTREECEEQGKAYIRKKVKTMENDKRKFGLTTPQIKIMAVVETGGEGGREHIHMIVFRNILEKEHLITKEGFCPFWADWGKGIPFCREMKDAKGLGYIAKYLTTDLGKLIYKSKKFGDKKVLTDYEIENAQILYGNGKRGMITKAMKKKLTDAQLGKIKKRQILKAALTARVNDRSGKNKSLLTEMLEEKEETDKARKEWADKVTKNESKSDKEVITMINLFGETVQLSRGKAKKHTEEPQLHWSQ